MKLITLIENTTCRKDLACEHGLSLYLETGGLRILFDAGQTDTFARNALKLGVDLSQVDLCVLSHGHYDHGGGLAQFLRINDHAPVYMSRHAFGGHYHGPERYIGLDASLRSSSRLIFAEDDLVIGDTLSLHTRLPLLQPIDPAGLTMLQDGRFLPEDFRHEQYLLIREGERRILISGCSHRGVVNIAAAFRPDVLIGGFHMSKTDPDGPGATQLKNAAGKLLSFPTAYYTGHCTGQRQFALLRGLMGDRLHALSTGLTALI